MMLENRLDIGSLIFWLELSEESVTIKRIRIQGTPMWKVIITGRNGIATVYSESVDGVRETSMCQTLFHADLRETIELAMEMAGGLRR